MTTANQPEHVPYEDASTPRQMHDDCAEATRNLRIPLPRRATELAAAVTAAPARLRVPAIAVPDRVAKLAAAVFDRPS